MKPIDQMNLAECLAKLRDVSTVLTRNEERQLADRIHDLTRWIPVSERMPTEEDLHSNGTFRIWLNGGDGLACIHHNKIYVWDDDGFVDYDETNFRVSFKYWQRITPPEAP
jgi:hypothetical protein